MVTTYSQPIGKISVKEIQRKIYQDYGHGAVSILPNFTPHGWWECDMFLVTKGGVFWEFEIKLSVSDFRADVKKHVCNWKERSSTSKHMLLRLADQKCPNRFYYVTTPEVSEKIKEELPPWAGLIEVRSWLEVVKKAPLLHTKKIDDSIIRQSHRSAMYRFWDLIQRQKIEETVIADG